MIRRFVLASCLLFAVAVILCSCAKKSDSNAPASALVTSVDSVMSPDSVMIYYDVTGNGDKALVFVHGWGGNRHYWNKTRDDLAKDFKVVTVDLGGHGQSGMGRADWTMKAFGGDVASVVKKLNLKDVILVGHSMGGAVDIEAARQLPGRVIALIGVDTYQDLVQRMPDEQVDQFLAAFRADFPATTAKFVKMMFPPDADSVVEAEVAEDLSAAPPIVAISALGNVLRYDGVAGLKDVRLPIRCINADLYPTNVDTNRTVAESFEVRYMPGYGHFLFLENPAAFNEQLRETLKEFWPPKTNSRWQT